ncbi:hypothetical protein Tco_0183204 [Tanacetum coccineum]
MHTARCFKEGFGRCGVMLRENVADLLWPSARKANVVAVCSMQEGYENHLRVRALVMDILGLDLPKQILNALTEARKAREHSESGCWMVGFKHLPLVVEFYNNSYHASIKAAPLKTLWRKVSFSLVCVGLEVGQV